MSNEMKPEKIQHFLGLAKAVSKASTCKRRKIGAVIVDKSNRVVSTGYSGAPVDSEHCESCWREENNIPSGHQYEKCRSVHAEMNALIFGDYKSFEGSSIFIYASSYKTGLPQTILPCFLCTRMLKNAYISKAYLYCTDEHGQDSYEEYSIDFLQAYHEKHMFGTSYDT